MFCQNCGAQFEGNFCPSCGTPRNPNGQKTRRKRDDATPSGKKPLVKKWWFWALIALAVILVVVAVLPESKTNGLDKMEETILFSGKADTNEAEKAQAEEPSVLGGTLQPEQEDVTTNALDLEGAVLLDQDGIRVTATELKKDEWLGQVIGVRIENDTDRAIIVQVMDVSVNGAMVTPLFSSDVAARMEADGEIAFYQQDLDNAGIDTIQTIELKVAVYNPENWETIVQTERMTIRTNAAQKQQVFDDSGFTALNQDGFRLVVRGEEENLWGKGISVFLENNTGSDVTVQLQDVKVNGVSVDPFFIYYILNGKVAYTSITFLSEDLKTAGISAFETIEFSVLVYDIKSWATIIESSPVTLTFPL
jgi:hypothetical protein